MKKMCFFYLALGLLLFSCGDDPIEPYPEEDPNEIVDNKPSGEAEPDKNTGEISVTGNALVEGVMSARVCGYVNVESNALSNSVFGVIYSENPDLSLEDCMEVCYSRELQNHLFKINIFNLTQNKEYYYRAFTKIGNNVVYGAVKKFTTQEIKMVASYKGVEDNCYNFSLVTNFVPLDMEQYAKNIQYQIRSSGVTHLKRYVSKDDYQQNGIFKISVNKLDLPNKRSCYFIADCFEKKSNSQDFTTDILVKDISLSESSLDILQGETYKLEVTISPSDASDKSVEWELSKKGIVQVDNDWNITTVGNSTGTTVLTIKSKENPNIYKTCTINVHPAKGGHEYVDLGLPSGLLWATNDLSKNYSWGKTDFASVEWGNGWRMPTSSELQELLNNCTISTSSFEGFEGFKIKGPNGNSIFLKYSNSQHLSSGNFSRYLSSSLNEDGKAAVLYLKEYRDSWTGAGIIKEIVYLEASQLFSIRPVHAR